jgi:hypothetical protein
MHAQSANTLIPDPYRAGVQLGEALAASTPEIVFLFSSIHYGSPPELVEGLYDGLGRDDVIVIGNTGDGCYETNCVTDHGAVALGINGNGEVQWQLAYSEGVSADPEGTTRRALAALKEKMGGKQPSLIYLLNP